MLLIGIAVLAAVELAKYLVAGTYAADFHGGMWVAAHDVLAGRSPYPPADPGVLFLRQTAFVTPPLLALLAIPFTVLPFQVAVLLWSLISAGALAAALYLVGVRDDRVYVVALCSFPFVESLGFGQAEGLLAMGVALCWHQRDSWKVGVVVGLLVCAKLFAWPLLLWLIVTRRIRAAIVGVASAVISLAACWAAIGFKGIIGYPQLLIADAHAFERSSFSLASALMHAGVPETGGRIVLVAGSVLATGLFLRRRSTDRDWFTAMTGLGLLLSPVLWVHYLVVLLVPLAIARRRLDAIWMCTAILWLLPVHEESGVWQATLVVVTVAAIVAGSASTSMRLVRTPATAGQMG
jgi:hypothetical protein